MCAKISNTPISYISDVKRSPMAIFEKANQEETGVYIFNHKEIAGIILTQKQYEFLNDEIE